MFALEVQNLKKVYPGFTLDGISFAVEEGTIAGLIGRNGAGKSTTLKSIMRQISSEGTVKVFGKDFSEEEGSVKELIGYVGGGFRFYPHKTLSAVASAAAGFIPIGTVRVSNAVAKSTRSSSLKRYASFPKG